MKQLACILTLAGILIRGTAAQFHENQMNDFVWVASQVSGTLVAYETSGAPAGISVQAGGLPMGVCLAENGHVYATQSATGRVLRCAANGAEPVDFVVGTAPAAIAVDGDGHLWVTDAGAPRFYKVAPDGTVLLTITPGVTPMTFYGGVAVNRLGQVWVANHNDSHVYVYDTRGNAASFSPISVSTRHAGPFGVAVDGQGHCWVAYRSGGVLKFDHNSGAVLASTTSGNPSPVGVAVNHFNELYVANADANSGTLNYYNQNGLLLQTTTAGEALFGIALDGNGDVWATGTQSGTLLKFERWNLNRLGAFPTGAAPLYLGDFTGYVQANIFRQQACDDLDGDSYSNAAELRAGTNPFDNESTPAHPRPVQTGVASVGGTIWTAFRAWPDATFGFAAAASFNASRNPANGIEVPNTPRRIPLEDDGLYDYSFQSPHIFQHYGGFLDQNGDAYGQIHIPPSFARLVGTAFYIAFITLDGSKGMPITTISNCHPITVQR
ncbi:MAG: NHL repeat-containing protein [Planctomycetes bacterium]|nr:NHL repeat-containing protein [Planctomycetota bacterium]